MLKRLLLCSIAIKTSSNAYYYAQMQRFLYSYIYWSISKFAIHLLVRQVRVREQRKNSHILFSLHNIADQVSSNYSHPWCVFKIFQSNAIIHSKTELVMEKSGPTTGSTGPIKLKRVNFVEQSTSSKPSVSFKPSVDSRNDKEGRSCVPLRAGERGLSIQTCHWYTWFLTFSILCYIHLLSKLTLCDTHIIHPNTNFSSLFANV